MPNPKKRALKEMSAESIKDEKKSDEEEELDLDSENVETENVDTHNDMNNFMSMFQSSVVQKTEAKRRKTEQFLNASCKVSARKVDEIVQRQGGERKKLQDQYLTQVDTILNTWEGEISKSKDMEEKLANTFRQQQKFYTQHRTNQTRILKDLQTLYKQFSAAVDQLDKLHSTQQGDLSGELKREVSMLHKKYLMESHNSELAKMKKNMQQLLTSSF